MSTDFLFTKQTFMRGVASIGNLSGRAMVNISSTPDEADAKAIASDWAMIGRDLAGAIEEYGR